MAGLRKKRRIQLIALGLGFMVVAAVLIGVGFQSGISLYRSTSETVADTPAPDEVFRMGGMVVEGSIETTDGLRFVVTDMAVTVPVVYTGADQVPDLFGDGQGTVLTGSYVDGVFMAETILTKHDEKYMPAEVIDDLRAQGVYVEPES
jgi:cytochrome c-type biogenesis protein CcmE